MEILNVNETNITQSFSDNAIVNNNLFEISSNWLTVKENKKLENVISYEVAANCPLRMTLDDVVDEKGCLEVKPNVNDSDGCTVKIKMKNKYKIVRVGVVSEASVLEIFRDAGEYTTTIFADFIDEFEDASVYFAEVKFDRPTTETSIKFTRIKNHNRTTMFLYGIRIIVEEIATEKSSYEQLLDFNFFSGLLKMTMDTRDKIKKDDKKSESRNEKITDDIFDRPLDQQNKINDNNNEQQNQSEMCIENKDLIENNSNLNIKNFEASINIKLQQMEQRFINRINLFEENTNKKLNDMISLLETIKNHSS